ncbi:tetratricopeptide repeat protein [Deinococcus cellulosilyticus]|uniref:Sel1 repeat family protein n=1 Tax=Deinococcus cellulosilyticus (strain DSM 18568 / NBRC 106333 / KACC 11606 / 5516J-15) TaxID=1223518 RepID=A0A511NAL1_DEIC1|nr:SEL1-like repeat protein [Deinococcus cellulosilyticus]GEM49862.1 hypothetical protein DC3_54970 [Deinococcus cellulosilyticus NBRC 106333 = KACC 11606]
MKVWVGFLLLLGSAQAESLSDLREAAVQSKPAVQFQLAMQYDLLGFPANAQYWLFRAARGGSGTAQYNLYQRYRTGKTVQQNPQKALRWLKAAACSGLVNAQTQLALELETQDPVQAYLWLLQASKQNYPAALTALEKLQPTIQPLLPTGTETLPLPCSRPT